MLEEAVEVIRQLWSGELISHRGRHYTVENARLYTLPDEPLDVSSPPAARRRPQLAGRIGDGLIGTAPEADAVEAFDDGGGAGKPRYGQLTVCWAERTSEARRTALECWPNAALEGPLGQELPLPRHFEAAAEMVTEDDVAEAIVCGPDPERAPRGDRRVRRRRLRPRLRPPGRPRPGGLLPLLRARDPTPLRDARQLRPVTRHGRSAAGDVFRVPQDNSVVERREWHPCAARAQTFYELDEDLRLRDDNQAGGWSPRVARYGSRRVVSGRHVSSRRGSYERGSSCLASTAAAPVLRTSSKSS